MEVMFSPKSAEIILSVDSIGDPGVHSLKSLKFLRSKNGTFLGAPTLGSIRARAMMISSSWGGMGVDWNFKSRPPGLSSPGRPIWARPGR